jgi:hypothetical protein
LTAFIAQLALGNLPHNGSVARRATLSQVSRACWHVA